MKVRPGLPKRSRRKLVMLTVYDAPTAELLEQAGVDVLLVGDSLGMVLLGYDSTVPVTMDEMIHHAKAVRRGAKKSFVIGDLPLKGVEKGPAQTLASAKRFMKEAGCQAVKLEWGPRCLESARLLVNNRIPVMGHVGLTPQTAAKEGGFRVRAKEAQPAIDVAAQALAFEKAGAFAVLLECVPAPVAKTITELLRVPTFGIGAGPSCDGQVLVTNDLLGSFKKFKPRFVRSYADVHAVSLRAVGRFVSDVREKKFPTRKYSFGMPPQERRRFQSLARRIFRKTAR